MNNNDSFLRTSTVSVTNVNTATTTAPGFDTTAGTNLTPAIIFADADETLIVADPAHLTGSTANGGGGTDEIQLPDNSNLISLTTLIGFETVTIPANATVGMSPAQHDAFSTFTDAARQTIALEGPGDVTGISTIETYQLGSAGRTFTLGADGQNVTGGAGDDTVDIDGRTVTGTLNGGGGTNTLRLGDGADISLWLVSSFQTAELDTDASVTMNESHHRDFPTFLAPGLNEQITLAFRDIPGGGGAVTGAPAIETYVLNDAFDFTLGSPGQSVIGNADGRQTIRTSDSVDILTGTLEGGDGGPTKPDRLVLDDGDDISGATVSNIEEVFLLGTPSVTMTEAQYEGFQGFTLSSNPGTVTITSPVDGLTGNSAFDSYVLAAANRFTLSNSFQDVTGSDGDDTVDIGGFNPDGTLDGGGGTNTLELGDNADLTRAMISDFQIASVDAGAKVVMDESDHEGFSDIIGDGTNAIVLATADGDGQLTGDPDIETYFLSDAFVLTLGAAGQSVNGNSSFDQTVATGAIDAPTGTLEGGSSGNNVLRLDDGDDITGATVSGFNTVELEADASVTMNEAQHDAFTTFVAPGTEQITIAAPVDGLTGNADVETYVLAAANTFVLGAAGQNLTGSDGDDTVDVGSFAATGVLDGGGGTDTLVLGDGADISGADVSNFQNLTIAPDATVTIAAVQLAQFTGTITAPGAETINVVGDGDFATLANVETFQVGDDSTDTRTITVKEPGTNVTADSDSDAITFDVGGLTFTGTLTGDDNLDDDTVLAGDGANLRDGVFTEVTRLSLAPDATVGISAANLTRFSTAITGDAGSDNTLALISLGDFDFPAGGRTVSEIETVELRSQLSTTVILGDDFNAPGEDVRVTTPGFINGANTIDASAFMGEALIISDAGNLGGRDTIIGGDGADLLRGQDGGDSLVGGAGNDTLSGGSGGHDDLSGGPGNDEFVAGQFNFEATVIRDLEGGDAVRVLNLTGLDESHVRFKNDQLQIDNNTNGFGGNDIRITIDNDVSTLTFTVADDGGDTLITFISDTTPPSGFTVAFDDSVIVAAEAASSTFSFTGAEVDADYDYTVSSSGGGPDVIGSGTIATATDQIALADLSGLNPGTLTLSVTLTDPVGNTSGAQTATTALDFGPLVVENTDDGTLAELSGDGQLSLREAIALANDPSLVIDGFAGQVGKDAITFAPALADGTITLAEGDLAITSDLTIDGAGLGITVDGNTLDRVFKVDGGSGPQVEVELSGLTITGGSTTEDGGGIFNQQGTLTLIGTTVTGNTGREGGGIFNNGGTVTIDADSVIATNIATERGGGINLFGGGLDFQGTATGNQALSGSGGAIRSQSGMVEVTGATISGNTATINAGGIWLQDGATADIDRATISGNTAGNNGGGIGQRDDAGTLTVTNSTISGNTAMVEFGGGVFVEATTTLNHVTITGNRAGPDANVLANVEGGGVAVAQSGTLTLRDSLISGNDAEGSGNELSFATGANLSRLGTNLFGDDSQTTVEAVGGNVLFAVGGDVRATSDGSDPTPLTEILDPVLRDNGGPTLTHALTVDGPAIDAAGSLALSEDQRGETRPVGLDNDIGAVEAETTLSATDDGGTGFTTDEETGFTTVSVLGNDTPAGANVVAFDAAGTLGTVTDNGDGTFNYDPDGMFERLGVGASAEDTFTYILFNGTGGVDIATVTLTVTGVNDAPTAPTTGTVTTDEDMTAAPVAIRADDVDETDTLIYSVKPGFEPAKGTVDFTGDNFTYTPFADADGADAFTILIEDGKGGSAEQAVTVTITPVNDAPSFTVGADQSVGEDAGAQTVADFITGISAGPTDESGQTVGFDVSTDNDALFAVVPSIDANGTLTYTGAADASGTATVTVTATDDGGTANGGVDTSAPQTFTLNLTPVNDPPSFVIGADQDFRGPGVAGTPQSVPGFIDTALFDPGGGTDEAGQTLADFVVAPQSDPNGVVAQVDIDTAGTLTVTPADGVDGSAVIAVQVQDSGGTANGGVDTSAAQTFTINVDTLGPANTLVTAPAAPLSLNAGLFTITGTTEADALVQLFLDTNDNGVIDGSDSMVEMLQLSGGDTAFTFDVSLTQGQANAFLITATDGFGNESAPVDVPTITEVDAPTTPTPPTPPTPTLPAPPPPIPDPDPEPSPVIEDIDGVPVTKTTTTDPDGTTTTTFDVDPVPDGGGGTDGAADIPLATDPDSGDAIVTLSLPPGFGAAAQVISPPPGPDGAQATLDDLIAALALAAEEGLSFTATVAAFVAGLAADAPVTITQVTPMLAEGTDPTQPLVIRGNGNSQEALIFDGSLLPPGTEVVFEDFEFVAVIGDVVVRGGDGDNLVIADEGAQDIVQGPGDDIVQGGGGDDRLASTTGNDEIRGDAGDDTLDGGAGDDSLDGGPGDDLILGGPGSDQAVFDGPADAFRIETAILGTRVIDTREDAPEGTDLLIGVDSFQFSDGQEGADARAVDAITARGFVSLLSAEPIQVAPGDVVLIDLPGGQSFAVLSGAALALQGVDGANRFSFDRPAADYGVLADGTQFLLFGPEGGGLALVPDDDPQTLQFTDGMIALTINGDQMMLGDQPVTDAFAAITADLDPLG